MLPWETPCVLVQPVQLTEEQQWKATPRWRAVPEHSKPPPEVRLAGQTSFDRVQAFPVVLAAIRVQLAAPGLETE